MRALLAAYPARLRRKHGAELIETLVEMSGSGGPPAFADKARLVIDGLGERFRPPTRRPLALAVAVLALLIGGSLGAAVGSWVGILGYAALPDPATLGLSAQSSASDHYLYADEPIPAGTDARTAAEQARQRLTAAGWRTGPIETGGALANFHFKAETPQTRLDVYAYPEIGSLQIAGWPQRPASYLPLTIAGTLLGLLLGWLIGVALAHRVQAARRPLRSGALTAAGLLLVLPSAAGFVASLLHYLTTADPQGRGALVHARGFVFGPTVDLMRTFDLGEGWILTPGDLQQLPLYGFALIAVAAIIARPRNLTSPSGGEALEHRP